mmetsp:Transcript_10376/g.23019  ORF Transcript_10376/g.23019 Transcript_10376/m.23019 type:complete len:89 (-) Transcript_10376:3017-3283(-)
MSYKFRAAVAREVHDQDVMAVLYKRLSDRRPVGGLSHPTVQKYNRRGAPPTVQQGPMQLYLRQKNLANRSAECLGNRLAKLRTAVMIQ